MVGPAVTRKLPLTGIKVLELAGLAPVPFAGMVLADFGANVCRVSKTNENFTLDSLGRGKKSICVDLKSQVGRNVFKRLVSNSDVLIEPFRPGVMEKLKIGPENLFKLNERLIYTRINGYGSVPTSLSQKAGHDINYLAIGGILSMLGQKGAKPEPPINLLGDFAGGSMVAVVGILMALLERGVSGKGQVVDTSITAGASYVSSFLHRSRDIGIWFGERGTNMLDGGAPFYQVYETKDGKHMAVGAIEPQFYRELLQGLDCKNEELFTVQMDFSKWTEMKTRFEEIFLTKTQEEWVRIFENKDACVTPILDLFNAHEHEHNKQSGSFMYNAASGRYEPKPAPHLSETPASAHVAVEPKIGEHTVEYLRDENFTAAEIEELLEAGVVEQWKPKSSL